MEKTPKLEIAWVRGKGGRGDIDFSLPNFFFSLGARGSGKSSYLEMCAIKCLEAGGQVFDIYASKDNESLGWLRSKYVKEQGKKIILLRGDMVGIKSEHENIRATEFRISDLDRADIFVSANACYSSMDDEFSSINQILDVLWKRHHWKKPIFLIMREAANLIYSRMKIRQNQNLAKAESVAMLRESRHSGTGVGLDSVRPTSVDIDLRALSDYLVLKNSGMYALPKDMYWVYKTFNPAAMRQLKPEEFVIIDRFGRLGFGRFGLPEFHKLVTEDIIREVGLSVEYFEDPRGDDEVRDVIAEALAALGGEPEPNAVSAWIQANKGQVVSPGVVGKQCRALGYRSEQVYKDGKLRRLIKRLP